MKDNFLLNFQSVKHGQANVAERLAKGNIFFIGTYGDLCLDLKLENYEVHAIDDIQKGVRWLHNYDRKRELPDVIIVNKKFDEISSAILQSLKKSDRLCEVPIIFIAEKFDQRERDMAVKLGIEDYYTDRVSAEYLVYRIEFLKRMKQLSDENPEEIDHPSSFHNDESTQMWSLKRTFDVVISATVLLLLSPLLLLISLAIKLDSKGPVFYISKRAGMGYQVFNFYKFRSMKENADQILEQLKFQNQYNKQEGDEALFFKLKNDPRVTKLGSFLRKTSLDELPQLINVLKGDMSLVGNRPLPLYEAERLTQDQWALRFLAPAGITGLWQITKRGRAEMSESERVALDMEYAKKNSFWYDLKIMVKTPAALLQKEDV